jgi:NADPH:quinone reductase-like Zn-dependent oxidoreductase
MPKRDMKALVFARAGEPHEVLQLADVPAPLPSPDTVVVEVQARPIHPADLAFIRGQYRVRPVLPQIAGLEGAGIVVVGDGDGRIAPGTRVAFRWPGSWAERAAVPVSRLITVPADIADDAACQVALNPVTAWGLLDEARVAAGDCIALTAATSTVANLVAAIARQRGMRVLGIARGDAARGAARSGADQVFAAEDPELAAHILAAAGERRVAALLDSVGGPLVATLLGTLAPGARVIAYGVQDRTPAAITNAMLIYANLTWTGFGIDRWLAQQPAGAIDAMVGALWSLIRDGTIALPVAARHPLAAFAAALAADAQPGRSGKVLLV